MLTLQFEPWMVPTLVLAIAAVLVYIVGKRQDENFLALNSFAIIALIVFAIAFVFGWALRGCIS